jgi:hypothetical protein
MGLGDSFDDLSLRPVLAKGLRADVALLEDPQVESSLPVQVAIAMGDTQPLRQSFDRGFGNPLLREGLRAVLLCEEPYAVPPREPGEERREFLMLRLAQERIPPLIPMVGSENQNAATHCLCLGSARGGKEIRI